MTHLGPVLTRISIYGNSKMFFFFFDLWILLVENWITEQTIIFEIRKSKESLRTSFALRVIHFGDFVHPDVACAMKSKQATQIRAVSSTASEARSIIPERQDHRSSRSARFDGPEHRVNHARRLKKKSRPSQTKFFIPLCLPNHTSTDQVATLFRTSIVVSPSLLHAWVFGAAPASQDISQER